MVPKMGDWYTGTSEEAKGWQAAGSALDNVGRSLVDLVKEMNYIYS